MAPRARAARATAGESGNGRPAAGDPAGLPESAGGGPRARLTREKVLRAALNIVDANGLAALAERVRTGPDPAAQAAASGREVWA